jgi:UDP-N-acetyl-D-galactosamine dehydrogenase
VVGFDINRKRIGNLHAGIDITREVEPADLAQATLTYESDPAAMAATDFYIVTVPTPIDDARMPDLGAMLGASEIVGDVLKRGNIVVFESTVYPGAVEEDCVPVLEKTSGLKGGSDFTVGYSPERINPGDKQHCFETITKVVSAQDARTFDIVANVYGSMVKAGIHRAPSIKIAGGRCRLAADVYFPIWATLPADIRDPAQSRPVLCYLVTEDWYFISHRLPMAIAAKDAGYDVHVATHANK